MSELGSLPSGPLLAAGACVGIAALGLRLYRVFHRDDFPWAPAGMIELVTALSSPRSPDALLDFSRDVPGDDRVFRVFMPVLERSYVIKDPATARAVLAAENTEKPDIYSYFDGVSSFQPTMFSSPSHAKWRATRKALAVSFRAAHVARMNRIAAEELRAWRARVLEPLADAGGLLEDASTEFIKLTIKIIAKAGFGYDISDAEADGFTHDLRLSVEEFQRRQMTIPFRSYVYLAFASGRAARAAAARNMALCQRILDSYRAASPEAKAAHAADETLVSRVDACEAYPDDRARCADLLILLLAGHDTTALTLSWILSDLAAHPGFQDRVRSALRKAAPEARTGVPELAAAVKESMRLNPVAATGSLRKLRDPLRIPDGRVLPAGSTAFMPFLLVHRGRAVDRAEEYVPERWLGPDPPEDQLMPFSAGIRNCLGKALATAEIYTVAADLVADFEFALERAPTPHYNLTRAPKGVAFRVRRAA